MISAVPAPEGATPETLPVDAEMIPPELRALPQWVCWRWEWRAGAARDSGTWTKVPISPMTGKRAATDDPATWDTFDAALDRYRRDRLAGVGFVFSPGDPFVGIDLDDCYDPATGAFTDEAAAIIGQLETYTERSPRGRGVKLIARAALPGGKGRRDAKRGIEMYDRGRFFALTGRTVHEQWLPCMERQAALDVLYRRLFPAKGDTSATVRPLVTAELNDLQIVTRAMNAKNGPKFGALWRGDWQGYGSQSEADAALCALLAFWTGPDPVRIAGLFRQSGLYREKWERADYREATIAKALEGRSEYHTPRAAVAPVAAGGEADHTSDDAAAADGDAGAATDQGEKPERKSQATKLIELTEAARVQLFHSPDQEAFVAIPIDGHIETWPLRSGHFRSWLMRQYFECHGGAPGAQAVQDALGVLEGRALFAGPEVSVFVRVAEWEGAVWIDLGDEHWRAVRIAADGWTVEARVPVRFRRSKGMAALPVPIAGGDLDALRPFINAGDDQTWCLIVAWLIGALRPKGPYPLLALHGEQGSAKSTTARALKAIIDPHTMPLRAEPKHEHDLMIAAANGWAVAFDNLSRLPAWLSDALCRLSTGGGFGTRELYTNRDEVLFSAMRPIILNGIEDLATRPDLLERAIVRWLPAIPEGQRRTEAEYWRDFSAALPRILGALYDAVSAALRHEATIQLTGKPRMADFAVWVSAAEAALGWEAGTFLAAYGDNRAESHGIALEAWPVAAPLAALAERYSQVEPWQGTATELLGVLGGRVEQEVLRRRDWPKDATRLSGQLRRYAPDLRATGIAVEAVRQGDRQRRRVVKVYAVAQNAATVAASAASAASDPATNGRAGKVAATDAAADAGAARGLAERPRGIVCPGEGLAGGADAADAADARCS